MNCSGMKSPGVRACEGNPDENRPADAYRKMSVQE